jgi:hypothetical protein
MSSDRNKDKIVKKMLEKEPEGLELWNQLTVKKNSSQKKIWQKN